MTKQFSAAFAMSFTHEEVVLERREPEGWRRLGAVRFATGDLSERLNKMRGDQRRMADGDGSPDTLLIIPDDQILYTTLTVPPNPEPALAIARALEGLTPYKVSDLSFDWVPAQDGHADSLRVAAVARRTLQEAEDFALEQGFRATGFVARPDPSIYPGQPDFGASNFALNLSRRGSVTEPELRRAGVTAASIADVPQPAKTEPIISGAAISHPVISRIVPHHLADTVAEPVAQPKPSAAPKEAREKTIAPQRRHVSSDLATVPAAPRRVVDPGATTSIGPMPTTPSNMRAPRGGNAPVIRHTTPQGDANSDTRILPPRAQAVHDRAAHARAVRTPDETDQAPKSAALIKAVQRVGLHGPSTFSVLMGLLVLGLVATLLLFGGGGSNDEAPDQVAASQPRTPAGPASEVDLVSAAELASLTPAPVTAQPEPLPVDEAVIEDTTEPQMETALTAPEAEELPLEATPEMIDAATQTAALAVPPVERPEELAQTLPVPEAQEAATQTEPATSPRPEPRNDELAQAINAALAEAQQADVPVAQAPAAASPAPLRTLALTRSARPITPPARTDAPETASATPVVPADPAPFEQRTETPPARVMGIRPPARPLDAAPTPAAAPAAVAPTPEPQAAAEPAPAAPPSGAVLQNSNRPPSRPGSLSWGLPVQENKPLTRQALTGDQINSLQSLLRDRRTAQVGPIRLNRIERDALVTLAQERPSRRPVDVSGSTQRAVNNALASALVDSPPPTKRPSPDVQQTAASPQAIGGLSRSARPVSRPAGAARQGAGNPSLSNAEVEKAIAAAVSSGPLSPGGVALSALKTSPLPPRRSTRAVAAAAAALAPSPSQPAANDAVSAEQRREDAALQAQAEARARERASADAQAEAQARAAAEARARAQAQAEARAAAARKQAYVPPEAEKEPDTVISIPKGSTSATVASAATIKDGIKVNRTQIIGTIGAGKGSRALVRLSSGRIITLRLGDKINGGTITDIGNSKITYSKGGRSSQLAVLDGR